MLTYLENMSRFFVDGAFLFKEFNETESKKLRRYVQEEKERFALKRVGRIRREWSPDYVPEQSPMKMKIFKLPYDEIMERDNPVKGMPLFLSKAFAHIRKFGLNVSGIFRISPPKADLEELKAKIDHGEKIQFKAIENVHIHTGIIKLFLKEMPTPLMTFELFPKFVETSKLDEETKLKELKRVLLELPKHHYVLVKALMKLLNMIDKNKDTNKMSSLNLTAVICPLILYAKDPDVSTMIDDIERCKSIVALMIVHYTKIFEGLGVSKKLGMKRAEGKSEDSESSDGKKKSKKKGTSNKTKSSEKSSRQGEKPVVLHGTLENPNGTQHSAQEDSNENTIHDDLNITNTTSTPIETPPSSTETSLPPSKVDLESSGTSSNQDSLEPLTPLKENTTPLQTPNTSVNVNQTSIKSLDNTSQDHENTSKEVVTESSVSSTPSSTSIPPQTIIATTSNPSVDSETQYLQSLHLRKGSILHRPSISSTEDMPASQLSFLLSQCKTVPVSLYFNLYPLLDTSFAFSKAVVSPTLHLEMDHVNQTLKSVAREIRDAIRDVLSASSELSQPLAQRMNLAASNIQKKILNLATLLRSYEPQLRPQILTSIIDFVKSIDILHDRVREITQEDYFTFICQKVLESCDHLENALTRSDPQTPLFSELVINSTLMLNMVLQSMVVELEDNDLILEMRNYLNESESNVNTLNDLFSTSHMDKDKEASIFKSLSIIKSHLDIVEKKLDRIPMKKISYKQHPLLKALLDCCEESLQHLIISQSENVKKLLYLYSELKQSVEGVYLEKEHIVIHFTAIQQYIRDIITIIDHDMKKNVTNDTITVLFNWYLHLMKHFQLTFQNTSTLRIFEIYEKVDPIVVLKDFVFMISPFIKMISYQGDYI